MSHKTVLTDEAVASLQLREDSVVVDCTLGSGGHAKAILSKLGNKGIFVGIDVDKTALQANESLKGESKATVLLIEQNFRNIKQVLADAGITQVDAILADLGWRMEQFDGTAGKPRGFSFKAEEPLAMTFGDPENYSFTAFDIVNDWKEVDIANVIYGYGEERYARRIAKKIVETRVISPICTSLELAEVVESAVPYSYTHKRTHPATKTFQALRIAVNDEFDALKELLFDGFECLSHKGRMSIISFHSLEDRIVKETFRSFMRDHQATLATKKPLQASPEELALNTRSRSAKLRTIEKL